MRYELLIALRHVAARRGRSLSLVTGLAVAGVALGVAALIGGLSITSGFEEAFRDKLLGVTAHIFARPYTSARYDARELEEQVRARVPGVVALSPTTYHKTILSGPLSTVGGFVKGIEPAGAARVLKLREYMTAGDLAALAPGATQPRAVLGAQLAERLGVGVGDFVTALSSSRGEGAPAAGGADPWAATDAATASHTFLVVGVFRAGYDEYDSRFAYLHISDAERLFGTTDNVRGFELKVRDPSDADRLAPEVASAIKWGLGGPLDWAEQLTRAPLSATRLASRAAEEFQVLGWYEQNATLYVSLLYQRLAILVVLSVMLILAACNVASMLIMMALERTRDVAILKAMGATDASVRLIFQVEGLLITVAGAAAGCAAGFLFCEGLLSRGVSLDPKVYGIDHFPMPFRPLDYLTAVLCALGVVGVAVSFPARRSAQLRPTEGLREDHLDA
ncbi:MAG: ABC transporter permease [Deltaproteobacteria bacterium]|nr:ABC transporter permease [Deltaproteobacteria bacterium]